MKDERKYYPREWGFANKAAEFYLDDHLLPVTPHTWKINNNNENESDQLVDGHPITIPKLDKAQSFSMDFIFLHDQYFYRDTYHTFVNYDPEKKGYADTDEIDTTLKAPRAGLDGSNQTFYEVKDLTDYLWQKKIDREPVVITIIYENQEDLNLKALLDDYTYTQKAESASDYEFSLTFTEYHQALNQEIDVELQTTLSKHNVRALRSRNQGLRTKYSIGEQVFSPETYEAETGKHSPSWEEIKKQMEHWLNTEYKKLKGEDYTDFDTAFETWWKSDPDRANLPMPKGDKELGFWWNDFMEQSKAQQENEDKLADLQAWLNAELKKMTDDPPDNFWERFKMWWDNNPTIDKNMQRPDTDAELLNWWNDFQNKSQQEEARKKKLGDVQAWLNGELPKVGETPTGEWPTDLNKWWSKQPELGDKHCPTEESELFNWWDDFQARSLRDKTLQDIKDWLNAELKKLTENPPMDFDEGFAMWWNSDPDRVNSGMHMPDTDDELLNWWADFMHNTESDNQALEEIKHWLDTEVRKIKKYPPKQFKDRFQLWWDSDPDRKQRPAPQTNRELINWWHDFKRQSENLEARTKKWGDIKAWLNKELEKLTFEAPLEFWEGFKAWWDSDASRKDLHMPDDEDELFAWWDDFMEKSGVK